MANNWVPLEKLAPKQPSLDKVIVPIPFRSGETEVSKTQVLVRILYLEQKREETQKPFEKFKQKLYLG